MKKIFLILFVLLSVIGYSQRAVSGDTLKIRGGGSFRGVVDMDTNRIIKLDTATGQYDAVPLFQIMDSIDAVTGAVTYWTRVGGKLYPSTSTDVITAPYINKSIIVDGIKYPATGAGIQSAIDDLPATGGEVIIPAGTYTIDTTILISKPSVYIVGQTIGWQGALAAPIGTFLQLDSAANCDMFNFNKSGSNAFFGGIRNLGLDGKKADQTTESNGIVITGLHSDLSFQNIVVSYCNGSGIKITSPFPVWNIWVTDSWLEYNVDAGITAIPQTQYVRWLHIDGNHFVAEEETNAIYFEGGTLNVRESFITNNLIYKAKQHSIYIKSCDNIIISNNVIMNGGTQTANTYDGIYITDDGVNASENIIITNNRIGGIKTLAGGFVSYPRFGISLNSLTDRVTITGNDFTNNVADIFTSTGANQNGIISNYDFINKYYYIDKNTVVDGVLTADSVHAAWFGGSDTKIGEAGSKLTIGMDSALLVSSPGVKNGSTAIVNGDAIYDFISTVIGSGIDHGALSGLTDDDHTQYALLAGRTSGQTLIGGTTTTADLTLKTTSTTGTTGADMHFVAGNGTEALTILNGAKVGILTQNPFSKFQIGNPTGAVTSALNIDANIFGLFNATRGNLNIFTTDVATGDYGGIITLGGESGQPTTPYGFAQIKGAKEAGGTYNGYLSLFTTTSGGSYNENVRLTSAGYVGIKSTLPDRPLEVNSATGLGIRTTYNDADGSAANYVDYSVGSTGDATITPSGGDLTVAGTTTATRFTSSIATGTQPYAATSTTLNTNLNADLLDGHHFSELTDSLNLIRDTLDQHRIDINALFDTAAIHLDTLQQHRIDINALNTGVSIPVSQIAFGNATSDGLTSDANLTRTSGLLTLTDGSLLLTGTTGTTPASGAGTRMMWIPEKAAFRVGSVGGTEWNADSIGMGSIALGTSTKSLNEASVAIGSGSIARGEISTAMGRNTVASGNISTAIGNGTKASGESSTAMGDGTQATGVSSTAIGRNNIVSGDISTAIGDSLVVSSYMETAIGRYNVGGGTVGTWVAADPIFEIGIGASTAARANALTVLKNGQSYFSKGIHVDSSYYDSSGDPGTSGQILSSTATGTNWIDESSITGFVPYTGATGNVDLGTHVLTADSVHAAWFGGSDTKIGEAGSKLTIGMDSTLLVSSPGVLNGSTAIVDGDDIYDFAVTNVAPLYDSLAKHLDTLQDLRTDINSIVPGTVLNGTGFVKASGTTISYDNTTYEPDLGHPAGDNYILRSSTLGVRSWFDASTSLHNPVTIGTANGLSLSNQVLSLALASTSTTGALSDTDWDTFNNKMNVDANLTLSGDVSALWKANEGGIATIQAAAVEGSMLNNNVISGQTALTTGITTTDELLVSDAGTIKRMDIGVLSELFDAEIKTVKVSLSAAQVNTLGSDFTLISAPGAGKVIDAISIIYRQVITTTLEVGSQNLLFNIGSQRTDIINSLIESSSTIINITNSTLITGAVGADENSAFTMKLSSSTNPSSGSATMDIYITYRIITL